jgi:hypothetical protein
MSQTSGRQLRWVAVGEMEERYCRAPAGRLQAGFSRFFSPEPFAFWTPPAGSFQTAQVLATIHARSGSRFVGHAAALQLACVGDALTIGTGRLAWS